MDRPKVSGIAKLTFTWIFTLLAAELIPVRVCAFEVFPEFHALTELEAAALDQTALIDSEYQSDVLTYTMSPAWDAEFWTKSNGLDLTLGSLSSKLFLQHTRFKARRRLLDELEVRFTYFQQRDLDSDETHVVLELAQPLWPWLTLTAYGEPSYSKRENDVGLAIELLQSATHTLRLFHTWVDFTRSQQSDRPDSYVNANEPRSIGFVGRISGERFVEYFARYQTKTRWLFPLEKYEYQHEHWAAGFSWRGRPGRPEGVTLNSRFEISRKLEGFFPYSAASSIVERSLDRRLIEALVSLEFPETTIFATRSVFEPGLGWFHRTWQSNSSDVLDHRNLIPFAWLRFLGKNSLAQRVELGYEVSFFASQGAEPLAPRELKAWAAEHRANFRYVMPFRDSAALTLALTGDVDSAIRGSGGLFEGGNGQFRVFF